MIEFSSSFAIPGRALDTSNPGVDGVDVVVFQGNGAERQRTDTFTGSDGSFTSYLTDTSQGIRNVQAGGIKSTSRVLDADCRSTGSITIPGFPFSPPQSITISFINSPKVT